MFGSLPMSCSSSRNSIKVRRVRYLTHPTNSYYFDLHKYAVGSKTQIEYPLGVLTIAAFFPFS